MNREGFWYSKHEPDLPMPVANGVPWEGQRDFLVALDRAENKAARAQARGMSMCRLCNGVNGSAEFSLCGWTWPSGFTHYVRMHNVKPSAAFLNFILNRGSV